MLNIKKGISEKIKSLRGDSLKAKSARGIVKLGAGAGVERVLRFVRTMILTRILAPDQFGLMAIVLVLVNVFEQLSEVGIKLAVVQNKRGTDPEFLNATWWFQAVRGIGLFVVAMLVAPWLSGFYGKPHLLKFLQVALLAIAFRGFISPKALVLQREYKFGLMVLHIQGSAFIGTIVTLASVLVLKNVWALVIGYVAENLSLCLLSYIIAPFRPRFGMDRTCFRELTTFAKGMFGLPSLTLIAYTTPTFVLGKIVSEEQLGLYALAGQLVNIPLILFNKIASPVILPGFAKKQDDTSSLNNLVLKISKLLASMIVPLVGFMIVCASALLFTVWGPEYVDATVPFVLLSLLIIPKMQGPILSSVYVAVGKPYLQRRFVIVMTFIIVVFIYPAVTHWGLIGAAATTVVANYVALFLQVFWCRRVIPLKFDDYVKRYIPGLLMAFVPAITVFLLALSGIKSLITFIISGLLALLVVYGIYFARAILTNNDRILLRTYGDSSVKENIAFIEGKETTTV